MRTFLSWFVAVIALLWIGYYFDSNYKKVEPVVAKPNEAGLCFKELLQYGDNMSWSETSAGRYDYTIYSTSQGIEVWVPCK